MDHQHKLSEEKKEDEFVSSLDLTPKKIKEDMENMKSIEGFPKGDDEDILELSNPPYYTAYPNPYIRKFISQKGSKYNSNTDNYKCEPFVGDVSEGKNDPIYNAHSYHTKVPHNAIIKYIEHYTKKGDVIFDGFCGSGMTGVAAKKIGRNCVLVDLGSAATFISSFYNVPKDASILNSKIQEIISEFEKEYGWLYQTKHEKTYGKIISMIYSDVFICRSCSNEFTLWDVAIDEDSGEVDSEFECPSCKNKLSKSDCIKKTQKIHDSILKKEIEIIAQKLVNIEYKVGTKRFSKKPDEFDLLTDKKISSYEIPYWFPSQRMPDGDESRRNDRTGRTHIHHFYSKRSLIVLSFLRTKFLQYKLPLSLLTILLINCSLMNRYGKRTGNVSGTLYIPSLCKDMNIIEYLMRKLEGAKGILKPIEQIKTYDTADTIISTQSLACLTNIDDNSFDYIFTDPPFGSNLMYSELNFIWEAWLKVITNIEDEAIINKTQRKDVIIYSELLSKCFKEYFRVLKPNRWITVEFHNTKAEIWRTIQEAIVKSGFVIGQVAVLDKQQGSFKQVNSTGTVKNDLVINAYKPSEEFRTSFLKKAGLNLEKDFLLMHLEKLPVEPNVERTQQMLYSKLLAQYIQNGFEVRMDASEFYGLLRNNFIERDGFWFNKEQIPEYEKRVKLKKSIGKFNLDQTVLGIDSEKTAIIWLAQFLRTARSYGEISIEYNKNLMTSDDKMPELKSMLEENFTTEEGKYRLPSIAEKKEKEDMRDKRLNKEFQEIMQQAQAGKKIAEVRKEALLHGLMKLYNERNVDLIKTLGNKLDKKIIESDDEIYAIIDWANAKEE